MKDQFSTTEKRIRRSFWLIAVVLGFFQAWASRMDLVNDTVSYLDMGDSIWHGHWSMAVNGIWGPLYAAILGLSVGLFRPSFLWEYPLVHLVLFIIFLFTLRCFDFLLREFISLRKETESPEEVAVPVWVWLTLGFTLFMWSSLSLIGVSETNPDMLIAAFFYLACALLLRIRRGQPGWTSYLWLGMALGFGYLTKSIMFPVGVVCLGAAFAIGQKQTRKVLSAVVVFLAISAPLIAALSVDKGRLTFGDSGRYNYAVHVDGLPRSHWQGNIPGNGRPVHGSREIFQRPATFEFGTPIGGTYPAWTDPSYWYDGVQIHFAPRREIGATLKLVRAESSFFFLLNGSLVAGVFLLFYMSGGKWSIARNLSAYWFLLIPSLTALAMYALIHIEPRYLAPFITVFLLSLFCSVRLPSSSESRRAFEAVAVLILVMFLVPVNASLASTRTFAHQLLGRPAADPNSPEEVVAQMYRLGLRPGDRIASLEWSLDGMSTWARLARVRIVAEIFYAREHPETLVNDFWKADPATQESVIERFAQTGAIAVVSHEPPAAPLTDWERAGNSEYYLHWLLPGEGIRRRTEDLATDAGGIPPK